MRGAMNIGAFIAGVMLIFSALNLPTMGWIVFLLGIYLSMKTLRKVLGGIIIYSRALKNGFQTAFFASLILAFFAYMSATLDTKLIPTLLAAAEEHLKTTGLIPEFVEYIVQQWRETLTPVVLAIITILMYTIIGGFAGVILALFVKNAEPGEFVEY